MRDPLRYTATARDILKRARQAADPEALVVALRAQAWVRHAALDNIGAVRLLDEARRIAVAEGLEQRLGEVLTTRAVAFHELGRHRAAVRDLAAAADLVPESHRCEVIFQRAVLEHNAGRIQAASDLYRQVLSNELCPPDTWVKAANNAALTATLLGRPRTALPWLHRAAELAEPLGPLPVAVTRNNLAVTTFQAGSVIEGLRLFAEAGRLYGPAGLPVGEHYLDYSDALVDLRLLDEALRIARAAAEEFEREGASLMAAEARVRSARLALAVDQQARAERDIAIAVEQLRRQRRPAWLAMARMAEAEIALAGGSPPAEVLPRLRRAARSLEKARLVAVAVEAHLIAGRAATHARRPAIAAEHLSAAARLSRRQGLLVRLRGWLARALHAELDGDRSAVSRAARQGLTDLARHRAALPSAELRALAGWHGAELGGLGLRSVMGTRSPTRVLAWMERTRTASLLAIEPPVPDVDEDVARLRAVEGTLRAARREHGREPEDLLSQRAALESRIRAASWTTSTPAAGSAGWLTRVGWGQVREVLARADGGAAWLAELAVVHDELWAVVGPATGRPRLLSLGPAPAAAQEAENALFALRRGLRGGRFAESAIEDALECLAMLHRTVIEPLQVPEDAPLVIVPAAPLQRLPWPALHPGPVTLAPSAAFWMRSAPPQATRPQATPPDSPEGIIALVAGPGLPGAIDEVNRLGRVHPSAVALLPPDSTAEATVRLITGAELAHLACHGQLRRDNPLFSALELSDGTLTVHELLSRGVAPRRVVLAACDSGVDASYHGNEVLGFVSALMARGTHAVLASLVPLPDGATVELMARLHGELASGASMATALHRARTTTAPTDPQEFAAWYGLAAYGAG